VGWYHEKPRRTRRYQVYKILGELKDNGPYTIEELSEVTGIHQKTVTRHVREVWALDIIYICEWCRNYRMPVPVFKWGRGIDRPQPDPYTDAEKAKRQRERVKERTCKKFLPVPGLAAIAKWGNYENE